ncbi:ZINC FINGER PROTEIN ZAT1-RELATED [Salix koriyanagi]|uniref:ZINC FINGER PROTEIN ZAT1-RELATED n=1 Tax=Salix koriyanagi TaxID=2511006 RepID=A0A9Q0YTK2_9ROSI|nr:ZINC FINGER PROTEIN ZAT1-RELATED [Salix koriyanagi]
MEKHKCKLCFKSFSNGRALGGHMRSHLLIHPIPPKLEDRFPNIEVSEDTESTSSSEEEAEEGHEEEEEEEKGVFYGPRENPKRSTRLVDPEFSLAAADAGSVVLQDRESESESSKNPTRRRSKRTKRLLEHHRQYHQQRPRQEQENNIIIEKLEFKKMGTIKTAAESSWGHEPEPVSSVSGTTTEEDVAFCLVMLSRDRWKRKEGEELAGAETDDSDEFKSCKTKTKGKYKCETCNRVFKSYQALGGHRASHKKLKVYTPSNKPKLEPTENAGASTSLPEKKIHECPYCFRVFSSGQALGGHKRSHLIGVAASASTPARTSTKIGDHNWGLIDLNLPAPVDDDDDDDISQVDQLYAVSDADFVNYVKR